MSVPNEIIIGDNFYRILKSFSNIINKYNFINNGEFKVTENIQYLTYNIKRKNILELNDMENSNKNSLSEKQPVSSFEEFHKKNDNKRVILVDDEQDIIFTYKFFFRK